MNFYDLSVPKLVFEIRAFCLLFLFDISVAFVPFPFDIPAVFADNPTVFVDIPTVSFLFYLDFLFKFE